MIIHYVHNDCHVDPGIEWDDTWDCACNGECPACGTKDIEPLSWEDEDDDALPIPLTTHAAHGCDNCGKLWAAGALKAIRDLEQRIDAGGLVPSGECPACGALCYPVEAAIAAEPGEPCAVIASVEEPPSLSLWIDFGSGEVERFDFADAEQRTFFLEGACTVLNRHGMDAALIYETEQDVLDSYDERPEIIVNPAFVKGEE